MNAFPPLLPCCPVASKVPRDAMQGRIWFCQDLEEPERESACSREMRQAVRAVLIGRVPTLVRDDAEYVAGELLVNACRYGTGESVGYRFTLLPGYFSHTYRYLTEPFDPEPPVDDDATRGRGLFLIRRRTTERAFALFAGVAVVRLIHRWEEPDQWGLERYLEGEAA